MTQLKQGEQIEDLQYKGLKIIQSADGYRFTTDAVLLANFVRGVKNKRIVEIGLGSGVIATLVAAKQHPASVVGIEILPKMADMAARSIEINGLCDVIKVVCADARGIHKTLGGGFDAVIVNPPYRKAGSGERQADDDIAVCRHEIKLTLDDVFLESSKLLKFGGNLFLVHQAERFASACATADKHGLKAKEVSLVYPRAGATPNLFLAKFTFGGKDGLKWLPPVTVFDNDGNYTPTIKKLYGESFD